MALNAFAVHGARGSFPVIGQPFLRYGGNTSCFSLETAQGMLVVDAGTGIYSLSEELLKRKTLPPITILLTHLHLDHLVGLSAFKVMLRPDARVRFVADAAVLEGWQEALQALIERPYWPISLKQVSASIEFKNLPGAGEEAGMDIYGINVQQCPVWHPQGCLSYRIAAPGKTIVLATDREHGTKSMDSAFLDFCSGADVLLHDAQFTPEEYPERIGWGHSTWEEGVRVAKETQVKQLILTSHDPSRSDQAIDHMLASARRHFPETLAATEDLVLT